MPKTLTLSAPKQFSTFYGGRTVTWDLLDEKGVGYRISWIAKAFDTHMPECMAFACKHDTRGMRKTCGMEYIPEWSNDELYPTECYRCSECGGMVNEGKPSFCPWCGAEVVDEDGSN